jgi:hypothetical protein
MPFINLTFEFIGITSAVHSENLYIVTDFIATSQVTDKNLNILSMNHEIFMGKVEGSENNAARCCKMCIDRLLHVP